MQRLEVSCAVRNIYIYIYIYIYVVSRLRVKSLRVFDNKRLYIMKQT
jgi:hypothetical protein